jgi:hypothetical protein
MFSCTRGMVRHLIISTLLPLTSCWFNTQAQDTIKLSKIDPPNWWAAMPKPMLLVQGEHLDGARFRLSDRSLHVDRTVISPNGHWAELWLARSPTKPETITIAVDGPNGKASATYRFDERHESQDGFAGFSSKDVMYLIMTDRFADGDSSNNGPDYDPSKPRAWHGNDKANGRPASRRALPASRVPYSFPRQPRHGALYGRAGSDDGEAQIGIYCFAHHARHAPDLLWRRTRYGRWQ